MVTIKYFTCILFFSYIIRTKINIVIFIQPTSKIMVASGLKLILNPSGRGVIAPFIRFAPP